jgi:peptide/nickel transport system ATP-binding protein
VTAPTGAGNDVAPTGDQHERLELIARPEGQQPVLDVAGLTTDLLTERGLIRAVDGVDLTVHAGETLGIVGESGSGKSVLLRSVMGLLRPSAARIGGSVTLSGQELIGLSRRELRRLWGRSVSIVFQDPMTSLNPVMRVGNQITEAIATDKNGQKIDRTERALELLRAVGIPEPRRRLRQFPHELSGGMRQRVAIAIALASDPALLLADEPTTALDVTVQAQILDLLARLQSRLRMGMILVSHDLGVMANRADTIAVMYAGRIVEQAPTSQLFWATRSPYTEALIRSIPRTDQPSHTRLYTIGGRPPDLANPPAGCRFAPRCSYAQDRCHAQEPPLVAVAEDPEHLYRCWFPVQPGPLPMTRTERSNALDKPEDLGSSDHPDTPGNN